MGRESHLWAVACCMLVGVASSFYATPMVDGKAYERIRRKCGWTVWQFHAGSAVLHLAPLWLVAARPPERVTLAHGAAAAGVHLAWAAVWVGTFHLDEVYVPLRPGQWAVLWSVALASELAAPMVGKEVAKMVCSS